MNEALIPIIGFMGFALHILTNPISGRQRLISLSVRLTDNDKYPMLKYQKKFIGNYLFTKGG